jgi:hypothetical protein
MIEPDRAYMAYLLRLWRVKDRGTVGWRASLESPHTGESQGFNNLDDLFTFLRRQTGADPSARFAD